MTATSQRSSLAAYAPPGVPVFVVVETRTAAHDIGIGADGAIWVIATNAVGGGYGIYAWNGDNRVETDGGGENISVDPRGFPWVTNHADNIYQRADLTTIPPIYFEDADSARQDLKDSNLTGLFIGPQEAGYEVKRTDPVTDTIVEVGTTVEVYMGRVV